MPEHDPLKAIWTNQKEEPIVMSEADIRAKAQKFDATIGWRNAREYLAAVFVVGVFGYYALTDANPVLKAGAALIVLATAFVTWRLATTASRKKPDPAVAWATHYRSELVSQRNALRSVWRWYALPFVPGLLTMMTARHIYPEFTLFEPDAWRALAWPLAFVGAIFGGVIWLNHVAAKKLQAEIDELDRTNRQ